MKKVLKSLFALAFTISASFSANAAFMINGSQSVGALELTESPLSFYDYDGFGSNTGYEEVDTYNFMIVEDANNYFLIGLIDAIAGVDVGRVVTSLTDNSSTTGSFVLIDDPTDAVTTSGLNTTITFLWAGGYTDGFIYDLGGLTNTVNVSIDLSRIVNLGTLSFVDFTSGTPTDVALGTSFTITSTPTFSVSVPGPKLFTLSLLCLAAIAVGRKRRI